jgi:hypothetical protein
MAAITLVVLINKGLDMVIARWDRAKAAVDGVPVELIADGRVNRHVIVRHDMGLAEVMEALRTKGVRNLGEVERAYMEAGGTISLFRFATPRPGLPILPPPEIAPPPPLPHPERADLACCSNCGAVVPGAEIGADATCPHCGGRNWALPQLAGPIGSGA